MCSQKISYTSPISASVELLHFAESRPTYENKRPLIRCLQRWALVGSTGTHSENTESGRQPAGNIRCKCRLYL